MGICVVVCVVVGYLESSYISLGVFAFLVAILILFYRLTVTVDDERLTASFGVGWIKFRFDLSTIKGCRQVKNSWWYGWGIRLTPHGWLYNIGGLDAVEIELSDHRLVRIGTDEPDALLRALEQRVRVK